MQSFLAWTSLCRDHTQPYFNFKFNHHLKKFYGLEQKFQLHCLKSQMTTFLLCVSLSCLFLVFVKLESCYASSVTQASVTQDDAFEDHQHYIRHQYFTALFCFSVESSHISPNLSVDGYLRPLLNIIFHLNILFYPVRLDYQTWMKTHGLPQANE